MAEKILCSYCGQKYDLKENKLFLFESSYDENILICNKCVELCNELLEAYEYRYDEEEKIINSREEDCNNIIKPSKIKNFFDEYVVNQERAKMILAVAIYNHRKRVFFNESSAKDEIKLKKSNVLMIGPTGSGKTLLIETIAKQFNMPLSITDATTLTESGYVGDDVEIILQKLIEDADGDIERAENGIVFIDEIDKIGRKDENPSIQKDVGGEGVQQALLKMLDGSVVRVQRSGNRKHPMKECYEIDTSNILFICSGAFEGIEKIISSRTKGKNYIGFNDSKEEAKRERDDFNSLIHQITTGDLRRFGMTPELLGRLPIICTLEELDRKALCKILTEPVDSIINQYKTLFMLDGIELEFTEDCLEAIADKAIELKTGARGLRAIMEDFMLKYMYEIPDESGVSSIILTKECVEGIGKPIIKKII